MGVLRRLLHPLDVLGDLFSDGDIRTTKSGTGGGDFYGRHLRLSPAGGVHIYDINGSLVEIFRFQADGQPAGKIVASVGPTSPSNDSFSIDVASGDVEFFGRVTNSGAILKGNILRPSSLPAGTYANYSPAGLIVGGKTAANTIIVAASGALTLTGLSAAQVDGTEINLFNPNTSPLSLQREAASSIAANRFNIPTGFSLGQYEGVRLVYDGSGQRWIAFEVRPKAYSTYLGLVASASTNYSSTSFASYAQQDIVRFSGTGGGTANIHGFPAATITPSFSLVNASTTTLVVNNQSATEATAANRFLIGANISVGPNKSAVFWYDPTSSAWRCLSVNL